MYDSFDSFDSFGYQNNPYRAKCVQWTGENASEVLALLTSTHGILSAEVFRSKYILIRHSDGIHTLFTDYWVVRGGNGEARLYSVDFLPALKDGDSYGATDKKIPIIYKAIK